MKLISVIVPAYNIEKYIGRCLESIINQTYADLEIIVVNDGSSDNTGDVIDSYARRDRRIIAIHKKNGGVSSARLEGLKRASGEYIGFVDGDDYIEAEMYEVLMNNAIKYKASISHCGYKMIFPDGHELLFHGTKDEIQFDHLRSLYELLEGSRVEPGLCNKLYHKSVISQFMHDNIWSSDIRINEDLLMNYLIFKKADNSIYLDIPYYHYILREGSASTSHVERYKLLDPLKVISLILEDVKNETTLEQVVFNRYMRCLINIANQKEWLDDAVNAKNTLKDSVKKDKRFRKYTSVKLKLMIICTAYFGEIYRLIRRLYDKLSGANNMYKI